MLVFRICGVRQNLYVYSLYRNPDPDNRIFAAHYCTITLPPSTILPPKWSANCKNRTEYTRLFFFFIRKNNNPTTPIGQHSRRKWFSEEGETSLLGKHKNKSMIVYKIQRWPQATKPITTNKNYNNQQGRSPTVPTTTTCKNDKECQGQQQQIALHTPQIPVSPSQGKPPATKTGRIIQSNNLLKVSPPMCNHYRQRLMN